MDTNSKHSTEFPSISQLFSDSWSTFTQSVLPLFLINCAVLVLSAILLAVIFLAFVILGFGSLLIQNFTKGVSSFMTPEFILSTVVMAIIFGLISAIVFFALQVATIIIVSEKGKISIFSAFKRSLGLILPLMFVGIITFFMATGAFFVFILPGLLVSFMLSFAQFEIILNNQRGLTAIKRSVLLITKNFGAIFIRTILLWLIYLGVFILISIIENLVKEDAQFIVSMFSLIINIALGWFGLAYSIILYKHAAIGFENQKSTGIAWLWILALVGWLIGGIIAFSSYKIFTSQFFKNAVSTELTQNVTNEQAKKYLDESQALFDQIIANKDNPDPEVIKKLNDQNISVLKKALELEKSAKIYFELGSAYTWISTEGTLEDSLKAFEEAEKLDPENITYIDNTAGMLIRLKRYDEAVLKLQKSIRIGQENNTESGFTHYSLGLAYAGLNLNSEAKTHIQKAIDMLSSRNKDGRFDDYILNAQKDLSNLSR